MLAVCVSNVPVNNEAEGCMPFSKKSSTNLTTKTVLSIFQKARTKYKAEFSKLPPVLPTGSQMFLYALGSNESLWETERKKLRYVLIMKILKVMIICFRCDQYRWAHLGVYDIKYNGTELKKRCNAVDDGTCDRKKGLFNDGSTGVMRIYISSITLGITKYLHRLNTEVQRIPGDHILDQLHT